MKKRSHDHKIIQVLASILLVAVLLTAQTVTTLALGSPDEPVLVEQEQPAANEAAAPSETIEGPQTEPGEGSAKDKAEPGQGSGEDVAEPGQGSGEDVAEPGQGSGEDVAEPGQGSEKVTAEPGQGSGKETAEPGQGSGEETAEPGQGSGEEIAEPGQGSRKVTEEPGQSSGEVTAEPGQGSGEDTDEPGEETEEDTDEPGEESAEEVGELDEELVEEMGLAAAGVNAPNSISGFFWVDGNGDLDTDWDGLYNGVELPLGGYSVFLYAADNLTASIAETQTDSDGLYIFTELQPGSYVLGIRGEAIGGIDYLPPIFITEDNKFAIDWSISGLPAYTEVIELAQDQAVQDINAGLRLPMGVALMSLHNIDLVNVAATIAGVPGVSYNGTNTLTFNAAATGNNYTLTHNGSRTVFLNIVVLTEVKTTLTLDNVKANQMIYMNIQGTAEVTMLLAGTSTFDGYITVLADATLTIDSATSLGSAQGALAITSSSTYNAGIGGYYNNTTGAKSNSGQIIINGGDLQVTLTGSGQNGAAIGGGNTTTGTVIINGGKVTATTGNTSGGAAIGGGSGGGGYVTINNGLVIATAHANSYGAAIGGGLTGTGNVTITGGTVEAKIVAGQNNGTGAAIGGGQGGGTGSGGANIVITGGNITAQSKNGAAIGGGQRSANANIDISGGTIEATATGISSTGAAIGGGGGPDGDLGATASAIAGSATINISGGNLRLQAYQGATIGYGGYNGATSPNTDEGLTGSVTITGGTIYAKHDLGSAVGTGKNNKWTPNLYVDSTADIMGFGKNIANFPGIYAGDNNAYYDEGVNKGDGYYVNANFELAIGEEKGLFLVYADSDLTKAPIRIADVPYAFHLFTYTTGSAPRNDYVYTGTYTGGLHQIIRKRDQSPLIYSVNSTFAYYPLQTFTVNYYRALAVQYGAEFDNIVYFPVTEYYVDINGVAIPGMDKSMTLVPYDTYYDKPIPAIDGYIGKGYKWESKPINSGDFLTDNPYKQIKKAETIYFVYDIRPNEVDLTVSKQVTGDYGDKTKVFPFTLALKDSNKVPLSAGKTYNYQITEAGSATPVSGKLTLDGSGQATFELAHNQTIVIEGVPTDAWLSIVEETDQNYWMTYTDSVHAGALFEFAMEFEEVGEQARIFAFKNDRIPPPPMGIDAGFTSMEALLLLTALVILAGFASFGHLRKRLLARILR